MGGGSRRRERRTGLRKTDENTQAGWLGRRRCTVERRRGGECGKREMDRDDVYKLKREDRRG